MSRSFLSLVAFALFASICPLSAYGAPDLVTPLTSGSPEGRVNPPDLAECPSGSDECCEDPITEVVFKCRGIPGGCFERNTQITLADRSLKSISEIKVGDMVFNPVTGRAARVKDVIGGPEKIGLIEFGYSQQTTPGVVSGMLGMITAPIPEKATKVKVTVTHPVLTQDGIKQAKFLTLADSVRGADGKFYPISTLRKLPATADQFVINLELDGSGSDDEHFIIADGIVTGDLHLQRKYQTMSLSK